MSRPAFKTSSVFHSPPDHLLNRDGKSAFVLSSYLVIPCVSSFLCVASVTLLVSLVYSAIPLLLNTSLPASSLLSLLNASPQHSGYSIRLFLPAFLLAASPWNAGKDREGLGSSCSLTLTPPLNLLLYASLLSIPHPRSEEKATLTVFAWQ